MIGGTEQQPIRFSHIFDRRQQNVSSLHECFEINLVTGCRCDRLNPLILQFRYKRRIYTQSYVDDKQLAKLHTKVRAHRGSVSTEVLLIRKGLA